MEEMESQYIQSIVTILNFENPSHSWLEWTKSSRKSDRKKICTTYWHKIVRFWLISRLVLSSENQVLHSEVPEGDHEREKEGKFLVNPQKVLKMDDVKR